MVTVCYPLKYCYSIKNNDRCNRRFSIKFIKYMETGDTFNDLVSGCMWRHPIEDREGMKQGQGQR